MVVRLTTLIILCLLSHIVVSGEMRTATTQIKNYSIPSAKDLKAIGYVENAHGQLDEWADRLVARLGRGMGPRESEPVLDGRARFQLQKLRITYAGYTPNENLIDAINKLADAHERRLDALDQMLVKGIDQNHYQAASTEVDLEIQAIRLWSEKR